MKSIIQHVVLLFFTLAMLSSCGKKNDKKNQAPPPTPVNIDTVNATNAVYYEAYPATISAFNEVEIHAQISGYITGIYFQDGQHVTKGQKLYQIDPQQYEGQYYQAVGNLNVQKANLIKAQKNADRYVELDKYDAIAKQVVDNALADLEAAKMQVSAAQANVQAVETNLKYTTIYAPFSGVIGISQVKYGSAVSPGTTVLNTISQETELAADFEVDEKEIPRFTKMQQQGTNAADSIFTIALPDGSIYNEPGRISVIDRAINSQTGTLRARLEFINPQSILKPGMTCNVRVKTQHENTILIPTKAITEQMGEYFVFVVGDSNKVSQMKIAQGMRIADKTVVMDGLKANDRIVTDGVQKLKDGAKVRLASDSTKQGGGADSTKKK